MNSCLFILFLAFYTAFGPYNQTALWEGSNFYDQFNFFTNGDPTNGYVNFVTRDVAQSKGYITSNTPVYMGADHSSVASGRGRDSVRLTSKQTWTVKPGSPSYLFVVDLVHMPTGCGTWPAWWFVGPNWPNGGEIDVIEGVNVNTQNAITLHTSAGCSLQKGPCGTGTRSNHPNCQSSGGDNSGCGISGAPNSYGAPFNSRQGGVNVLLWDHQNISSWYFPRGNIPSDLSRTSTSANPSGWGTPVAFWELGSNCPYTHFHDIAMVFDLTFCGDWAGNVFNSGCPGKGSCKTFVQNNPGQFADAYWSINFVKVMTDNQGFEISK